MVLKERIALMLRLGDYLADQGQEDWMRVQENAAYQNPWFIPQYIRHAIENIRNNYLEEDLLEEWLKDYSFSNREEKQPCVGMVMAGNIPLVGFHDFLAGFLSGCRLKLKLSSKDEVLWSHILSKLSGWAPDFADRVSSVEQLKNCDAYIATGSNNTARYFEYYFQKYPHIIRSNRTAAAILSGRETYAELERLSDDIGLYFGMGCRNVSKIFVPENYNFEPLIQALDKYAYHMDHNKYRNNYDFHLAMYLLNKVPYMSSKSLLIVPSESLFAPVSVLHYEYYQDAAGIYDKWSDSSSLQCLIGNEQYFDGKFRLIPFGTAQSPGLDQYADQVNTLTFLQNLKNK